MKFKVKHRFKNISRADYEKLYFDEPFNIAMCEAVKLHRVLESLEVKDGKLARSVRVAPEREIPAPIAKVMGTDKIEYVEHLNYTFGSFEGDWRTVPGLMADRIQTQGTVGFDEVGGEIERWVAGEIKVKILGLGSVVERVMVAEVEKSYQEAADFTQAWIDDGGVEKLAAAANA